MSLFQELQRRNVIRVATAYVVVAWLIIQVVGTISPAFGDAEKAVRVVVIILGIGFLPAVISTWVFQFTADGLKLDKDAGVAPPAAGASKSLDRAIIVVLLLGISFFAFDKFVLAPDRAAVRETAVAEQAAAKARVGFYGDRSVAVIPFHNMTSDPEQEYFVDGIAEEVLNLLARIRELRVISRSSAFAFKGQNLEIPDIAERLDVAHILEGSVRKVGNTVRVTAQLIEARTDTHLWSKTYERDLDDVFAIQDEIAADVAKNLEITLLEPLPTTRYVDPEVIALTAQAEQLNQTRPDGAGGKIYTLASRALEIDPEYIPALSQMVGAYWYLADETDTTWEETQRKIDETYERIRELDPDNADPDYYYGFMLSGENKLEEAAALYSSALKKDLTMADGIRLAAYFAMHIDELDTAVRLFRVALATDPLCHQCRRRYAESLMFAGDYANAQWEFERYLAASNHGWEDYVLTLLLQGKTTEAIEYIDSVDIDADDENYEWNDQSVRGLRAMSLYSQGKFAEADRVFDGLTSMQVHDHRVLMFRVAQAAAWMGKDDLAFEKLFEMAASKFQYLHRKTFSPIWQNLHDDPRWLEYREFNGTYPARLDAIEFNPELPE